MWPSLESLNGMVQAIAPIVSVGTVPTISNRYAPSIVVDSGPILAHLNKNFSTRTPEAILEWALEHLLHLNGLQEVWISPPAMLSRSLD